MKRLELFARLLTSDGTPWAGQALHLDAFSLHAADWVTLSDGVSDAQGQVHLRVDMPLADEATAPLVRLSVADTSPVQVLAEGGRVSFASRSGTLSIDVGTVHALPEPLPLTPSSTDKRFRDAPPTAMRGVGTAARPLFQAAALNAGAPSVSAATLASVRPTVSIAAAPAAVASAAAVNLGRVDTVADGVKPVAADSPVLLDLRNQLDTTRLDLSNLNTLHLATQNELKTAQLERSQLQTQVQTLTADKLSLSKQLADIQARPTLNNAVPLHELTKNLQTQFSDASAAISRQDSGLRLGDVRITLRGKLAGDGRFELPQADEVLKAGSAGLDEVSFGLAAPPAADAELQVPVPQLARLTEGAARQVLQSLGLRLDTATGAPQEGFVSGQAVRQVPAAGARAPRGGTVLVVFAQ